MSKKTEHIKASLERKEHDDEAQANILLLKEITFLSRGNQQHYKFDEG